MKLPRLAPWVCSLTLLAALPACQGKGPAPAPSGATQKAAAAKAPANDAKASEAKVADAKASETTVPAPDAKAPPTAPGQADPLGASRVDPGWYRKTMFGDKGEVLDTKRSEADDQGRFQSLIRFKLTDMTTEACADHLQTMVEKDIPNVQRKEMPGGRVQISGSTERYKITFMCGTADGMTVAYVSYSWT